MSKKNYRKIIPWLVSLTIMVNAYGQNVGINNTNPLSTFDITGSYGYGIRAVSSSATLASTDATVLASPGITLTLPASASVTRRVVLIVYNGSYGSSAVTVKPAGTDHVVSNNVSYAAASGITLSIGSIALQTDGSGNWYATMNSGAQSGNNWLLSGNAGTTASNFLGTTDNIGMGIRTNNTQRIHIDSLGRIGIGTNSIGFFDPTNPEELLVDYTGSASGTVANFTGSRNDFVQINVQNKNSGTNASSDYVATADNGTDSTYYIDMGINSSTYTPSVDNFGGPDDGYLYTYARNLVVGTDAPGSDLIFLLAGGSIKNNTAMRMVTPTRNIVIGKGEATNLPLGNVIRGPNASTSFTNIAGGSLTLQGGSSTGTTAGANVYIYGGASASGTGGSVNLNNSANFATNINTGTSTSDVTIGNSSDNIIFPKFTSAGGVFYTGAVSGQVANTGAGTSGYVLQANGAGFAPSWVTASSLATGTSWLLLGNSSITQPAAPGTYGTSTFGASENWIGNIDAKDFTIGTSNKERMRVLSTGNIGIGTATPAATLDVNGYNVSSGNTMNITSNALTTGTALNVTSSGTIITNGEVAQFTGNSASSGNIITVSGTGLTSGSAISATAGTTTGNAVSIAANGLTTGKALSVSSSSAAGTASGSSYLVGLSASGANSGASHTAYGINTSITNTGTTSINIAGLFSASGATNNYGIIVPGGGGNVGFGTTAPVQELEIGGNATTIRVGGLTSTAANQFATTGTQKVYLTDNGDLTAKVPGGQVTNENDWSIYGNANTTAGTHYLGTSDAVDFVVKSAGTERMRVLGAVGADQGNIGIGMTAPIYPLNLLTTVTTWALGAKFVNTGSTGTGVGGSNNGGGVLTVSGIGEGGAFTGLRYGAFGYFTPSTLGTAYNTPASGVYGAADLSASTTVADRYQFGVFGLKHQNSGSTGSDKRSGGVIGVTEDDNGSTTIKSWGALGYRSTGNTDYGLYCGTGASSTGAGGAGIAKRNYPAAEEIGLGSAGDLMGAWIRGNVYGLTVKGGRYGMYVDGVTYTNKPIVQLIDNGTGQRTVTYTVSSMSPDVYAHGKGKLVNGRASIQYDATFRQFVDATEDVTVTVTPMGKTNGIYLAQTDAKGFSVQENSDGNSNAEFTWIAIGTRKDAKDIEIAPEVVAKDFDSNIDNALFDDTNTPASASSMFWDGSRLVFSPVPNTGGLNLLPLTKPVYSIK